MNYKLKICLLLYFVTASLLPTLTVLAQDSPDQPCCYCQVRGVTGCMLTPVGKTCQEVVSQLGCNPEIDRYGATACEAYPSCPSPDSFQAPQPDPIKLKLNVPIPGLEQFAEGDGAVIDEKTLPTYIAAIYKFFVGIAGIVAVFMIVFGGVQWLFAGGAADKISSAKETIVGAVVGLILALGSYTILYIINPRLVILPDFLIPRVEYKGVEYKLTGQQCDPLPSGPCSVASLQSTCFGNMGNEVLLQAAGICRIESGGRSIPSGVDKCEPGGEVVSFGLFQINISANTMNGRNCPSAFNGGPYTSRDHTCTIADEGLYRQCRDDAMNAQLNIQKACELYRSRNNWSLWGANRVCRY